MERLKINFSEKSTTPATPTTCWPIQRTAADGPPIGPFATDCGARRWGSETAKSPPVPTSSQTPPAIHPTQRPPATGTEEWPTRWLTAIVIATC